MKLYSVATGYVDPFKKKSRKAAEFVSERKGFVAVHPAPDGYGTLWMFDSLKNARIAKAEMVEKGIQTGNNICEFECDDDLQNAKFIRGC